MRKSWSVVIVMLRHLFFTMHNRRAHQRRPLKSNRRGRGSNRKADEKRTQEFRKDREKVDKDSQLRVQQGNVGSFTACLNELRSRLAQEKPHVAIYQEVGNWPSGQCPYHFPGYFLIYRAHTTPRSIEQVRGGGVAILIRNDMHDRLTFDRLDEINLLPDVATEIVRARLFFKNPTGLSILDIVNIYRPPISSSNGDCRSQVFDMNDILTAVCSNNDDMDSCTSRAILLGGDLNAHSKLWDSHNREDKLGTNIATSLLEHGFTVANDGGATYYARPNVRTAPDITCSRGDISIRNWNCAEPYGKCHHNIISYDVVMSYASLHSLSTSFLNHLYRTRPSWQNINYTQYNSHLEHTLFTIFARDPLPSTAKAQVHFLAKALTHAFKTASQTLAPSRPSP